MRRLLAAGLSTALALGVLVGVVAPGASASPLGSPASLTELVQQLPTAPPLVVGYKGVEQFIPKAVAAKKDKFGCNLRQRTIIALATVKPKVGKRCSMKGGKWTINFGQKTVSSPKGLVLAPITSYKQAWGAGAYAWTPAQRLAWATNIGSTSVLRSKGVNTQATQTLVDWALLVDVKRAALISNDILASFKEDCRKNFLSCLALLPVLNAAFQGLTQGAAKPCTQTATYVSNMLAWGLTVDSWTASELSETTRACAGTYYVNGETKAWGIIPIPPASAVPAAYVAKSTPIFTGYGQPDTAPVTGMFGLMAPPDWPSPTVTTQALRLWDSGVSWAQMEPVKGVIDYSKLDAAIARATQLHAKVVYVLGNTPAWANGGKAGNVPPTDHRDAAKFIGSLCSKYQGSIAEYEVWNEGNIVEFWAGTPQQLADLTKAVKEEVTSCFPAAKVIASSAGARAEGGFATRYQPYLTALREGGWPVDAFAVHSYPKASGGPMDRVGIIKQWKAMLAGAGAPDLPLYDSELNYGLAGLGQPRVPVDDLTGAAWIAQSFIQSVQFGIDGVDWFLWTGDAPYDKVGIQLNSKTGLQVRAWNTVAGWLDGARMQRCAQQDNVQACQITRANGTNATLVWTISGTAPVTVTGLGTQACPLLLSCQPITKNELQIGDQPVMIS